MSFDSALPIYRKFSKENPRKLHSAGKFRFSVPSFSFSPVCFFFFYIFFCYFSEKHCVVASQSSLAFQCPFRSLGKSLCAFWTFPKRDEFVAEFTSMGKSSSISRQEMVIYNFILLTFFKKKNLNNYFYISISYTKY